METQTLPIFTIAIPLIVVVGGILVSKLLRVSLWAAILAGLLPLGVPFLDLPFEQQFIDLNPMVLVGGGWALLVAMMIGWSIVRPATENRESRGGMLRSLYSIVLIGALAVVGLLLARPELLETYAPGWRGSAGIVLLCASLLSMSLSLARVLRAAFIFAAWTVVSLVLASELFLNKLPQEIVREDLRKLEPLISRRVIDTTFDYLDKTEGDSVKRVRAVILGGGTAAGFPYPPSRALAGNLERVLSNGAAPVEVIDATGYGSTIYHLKSFIEQKISPMHPDLVLIAGWSGDSARGVNSYGIPGLSEREAAEKAAESERMRAMPAINAILSSRLYAFGKKMVTAEDRSVALHEDPVRVPASEYGSELEHVVQALKADGSEVVLIPELIPAQDEDAYRSAMVEVAARQGARFVALDEILAKQSNPHEIARGKLVSEEGYARLARSIVADLRSTNASDTKALGRIGDVIMPLTVGDIPTDDPRFEGLLGGAVRYIVKPSDVNGDLLVKARLLEAGTRFYRVTFSVNGRFVADRRLDSREATNFRFSVPSEFSSLPYVELAVRTIASPPADEDLIGSAQIALPVPIVATAEEKGLTAISVADETFESDERFLATTIDPRSGDVTSIVRTSDAGILNKWMLSQPWGSLVTAALRGGEGESVEGVRAGLRYIGLSNPPAAKKSSVLLGTAGIRSGDASSNSGSTRASYRWGSSTVRSYNRFLVEGVSVGNAPLKFIIDK